MKNLEYVSQPRRLFYLVIYAIIFMIISFYLFGSILPPLNDKGFWFYTGMASLVIGSLLVTPFYTNPANGLSYATAGLVAILYTKPPTITLGYELSLIIFSGVILFSLLSIATINLKSDFSQKFSSSSRILVENFGNPRILYLVLLIYAVFQFHLSSIKEIIWIFIAGLIAIVQLVELVDRTISKIWDQWILKKSITFVGKIVAYQTPNIVLARLVEDINLTKNRILLVKDPTFGLKLCYAIGFTGRDEGLLLRLLEISIPELPSHEINELFDNLDKNEVVQLTNDLTKDLKHDIIQRSNYFVGIVDSDSAIDTLYIEIVNEREITEGRLVEVTIKGVNVIYQILDGLTHEDIVQQKNKYGYARAKARKIGRWDNSLKKFTLVKWLPQINTPVYIKTSEDLDIPNSSIGTFPETNYFVSIKDYDSLVTHNTAILGILGVGKSFFAIELVERIMTNKIKIIVIDLTNQYANELKEFIDPIREESRINKIISAGNDDKNNFENNPQEGGSYSNIRRAFYDDIKEFLESKDYFLKIYNPS